MWLFKAAEQLSGAGHVLDGSAAGPASYCQRPLTDSDPEDGEVTVENLCGWWSSTSVVPELFVSSR